MSLFGLDEKYITLVKNILKKYINSSDAVVYVFCSREKGSYKEYSDIAIDYKEITDKTKSQIEFDFENSTLAYEVDIVDLNNISENFKNNIKDFLVNFEI